jgi:hypothetical protein
MEGSCGVKVCVSLLKQQRICNKVSVFKCTIRKQLELPSGWKSLVKMFLSSYGPPGI